MRKKKTDKKIEQTETKSRAKYECPEELNQQISVFNLVPFSFELPSFVAFSTEITDEYFSELQNQVPNELQLYDLFCEPYTQEVNKREIKKILEKIPENLARRITEYDAPAKEQLLYYECCRLNHLFLRDAVNFFAKCREVGVTSESGEVEARQWGLVPPTQISTMVIIDGKVNYKHIFPAGEILRGIEYDRLRSCAICEKIFWAKNKNSETCSEPCRNALRQRRHRQKNKEEVNAKRREYYMRNKKLKEIKEKKNGTL